MKARFILVTPALATRWIKNSNSKNRNVRQSHVDRLARDMATGRWHCNGESIKFDLTGRMYDGQHRCLACIQSKTSIRTLVCTSMPEDGFSTVDIGAGKIYADHLSPHDEMHSTLLAATVRWVSILIQNGQIWKDSNLNPTVSEMEVVLKCFPSIRDSVSFTAKKRILGIRPSLTALLHFVACRNGEQDLVEVFIERCLIGEGLYKSDPEFLLRAFLLSNAQAIRKAQPDHIKQLFIKTWAHARAMKKMNVLRIREDELPPVFGMPRKDVDLWKAACK